MRFVKMHGLGNDYVYVDCFDQQVAEPGALAIKVSDRHFGIGSDGLILVMSSEVADVRMRMFNADGSEAEMCGNGIRCVAKYACDHDRARVNPMRIETGAGIKSVQLSFDANGYVSAVTVDMGEPILEPDLVPVKIPQKGPVVDAPMRSSKHAYKMTCVSMGNPHAVMFVDDVAAVPLAKVGPEIENNPLFPRRVNAHFVQVHSKGEVTMRTWERGSGMTLACGTGAAAVCVAGALAKRTGRDIVAHLPGGDLRLEWRRDNHVYMTGPAVEVFAGEWKD